MEINDPIYVNFFPEGSTPLDESQDNLNAQAEALQSDNYAELATGSIGSWVIDIGRLYSGDNAIVLDALNKAISINNQTFGNSGIQLQYNDGTPRMYVGNGTDQYMQWDGTTLTIAGDISAGSALLGDLTLGDGTTDSGTITMNLADGEGDCYIAGGTFDASAWTATGGFILGLDDSDSNKEKFFIGSSASSMDWNVTTADTLTVKGTINATGGYIGASTALVTESTGLNVGTTGHVRGGQTGYNTGTGFFLGYDTDAYKFSVGNPSGNYIAWTGSDFIVNGFVLSSKGAFGGDGSDGALTISTDTNFDAGSAIYVTKNYTNLTIDATKTWTLTNPGSKGTLVHLKVSGDLTINGKIDFSGADDNGKGGAFCLVDPTGRVGKDGSPAAQGAKAGNGGNGGNGHSGLGATGTTGTNNSANEANDSAGNPFYITNGYADFVPGKFVAAFCGGTGGTGGAVDGAGDGPGAGGGGGAGLIIEVLGDVTYGASSTIDLSGGDGGAGGTGDGSYGEGGGGGGSGGIGMILYNGSLTDSGLTETVTAGSGGSGGGNGGAGGNGVAGYISTIVNNSLA